MPINDDEKRKAYMAAYRQRHAEKEKLRKAAWLAANKSRQADRLRAWRHAKAAQEAIAALSAVKEQL